MALFSAPLQQRQEGISGCETDMDCSHQQNVSLLQIQSSEIVLGLPYHKQSFSHRLDDELKHPWLT